MRTSTITAKLSSDPETVWNIVTNNSDYAWRSDLSKIEVHENGKKFIEYTKNGFSTCFTITEKRPFTLYAFDMENSNFKGHWTGEFKACENGGTELTLTEALSIKNPVVELFSHIFMNLKKMQRAYVRDLKAKLGETDN